MPSPKRKSTRNVLLAHSRAKVELLRGYLSVYLNILSRSTHVDEVYIFDLMCGEGVYEDGSAGSSITILNTTRDHYFANDRTCPIITVWFNDPGISDIEQDEMKVRRAERFCEQIFRPPSVKVEYFEQDWRTLLEPALRVAHTSVRSRSLFFVDPHGYKEVGVNHVHRILASGKTELIVFVPASHQYRFAEKAMRGVWSGGEALRKFLLDLFENERPRFSSVEDYVRKIRDAFRVQLGAGVFVDTFTLEASRPNVYALFFFTSNALGFEKMLETKWRIDTDRGHGFVLAAQPSMFDQTEVDDYSGKLMTYLRGAEWRTNEDLYLFGLQNGYLPKHTRQTLNRAKSKGVEIEVISLDESPARGYYIAYNHERRIAVRVNS